MTSRKPPARPWSARPAQNARGGETGSLNFVGGSQAQTSQAAHPWLRNEEQMQMQPRPVSAQARLALPPATSATRPGSASATRPGSAASTRPGSATGARGVPGMTQEESTDQGRDGRGSMSRRASSAFSRSSSISRTRSGGEDSDDEDAQYLEKHSGKVNWEAISRAERTIFASASLKMETALAELNLLGGTPSLEGGGSTIASEEPNQFRTAVCCRVLDTLADSMHEKHRFLYKRIAQEMLFSIYGAYPKPGSERGKAALSEPFRFDLVPYYAKWESLHNDVSLVRRERDILQVPKCLGSSIQGG